MKNRNKKRICGESAEIVYICKDYGTFLNPFL
jgi:hypothetical protein